MRRVLWFVGLAVAGPGLGADPTVPGGEPKVKVAVFADEGARKTRGVVADEIEAIPGYTVDLLNGEDVRAGKLSGYKLFVCPGGSGSGQAKALGDDGRAKVKEFVRTGGGYLGICAGAYLASRSYPWSLHILDAEVLDREHWARGTGDVELKLSPKGKEFFRKSEEKVGVYYGQGPLLAPGKDPGIPDFEPLAAYETEIHSKNGAKPGVMKGTTAAARGTYGDGRVFAFSPHPEKSTDETKAMFRRAVVWAAGE